MKILHKSVPKFLLTIATVLTAYDVGVQCEFKQLVHTRFTEMVLQRLRMFKQSILHVLCVHTDDM